MLKSKNAAPPSVHPEVVGDFSLSSLGGRRGAGRGGPLQAIPSPRPSPRSTWRGRSCQWTSSQPTPWGCTARRFGGAVAMAFLLALAGSLSAAERKPARAKGRTPPAETNTVAAVTAGALASIVV